MALPATGAGSPAAPLARQPLARQWHAPFPVDVRLVLSVHRRGPRDPAYRIGADGAVWRTSRTPDGPGTLRVTARPAGPAAAGPGTGTRSGGTGSAGASVLATIGDAARGGSAAGSVSATTGTPLPGAVAVTEVSATAWGPGAQWLLDSLPSLRGPAGY